MTVPPEFGSEFLYWFKNLTESYWANHNALTLEQYAQAGVGGSDWQKGTKWLGGLTDSQILKVEEECSMVFPPDYRVFLQHLHCVDRPMIGAAFIADQGQSLSPITRQPFCNWLTDKGALEQKYSAIIEGIEFDIEYNNTWMNSWGEKPDLLSLQKERLRQVHRNAPKLIPVFSHRFLLAEPAVSGNPVLSIHQTDVIIYGRDLRTYLLREFQSILGIDASDIPSDEDAYEAAFRIPFWGELLS